MMMLKSMSIITNGLERQYTIYLVKQNMLYISLNVQKKCKLMHHVYSIIKIGCNETMRAILLGDYILFAWYVFYFIQILFFLFL
jgi:hypothetical protein